MRALLAMVLWWSATPATAESLLGGRFTMQLPERMVVVENPRDSYGLRQARWSTMRAELAGDERSALVLIASETFTTAGPKLRDQVRAELAAQQITARVSELTLPGDVRGIAVDPPLPKQRADAELIHAAYVAGADAMVAVVAFYAKGRTDPARVREWARLARASTATLRGGYQLAPSSPHVRIGETSVTVQLGARWGAIVLIGERANSALELREVVPLGQPAASCSIAEGTLAARDDVDRRPVTLLGKATVWLAWHEREHHAEVEVAVGGSRLRATCRALSRTALDASVAVVETLRVLRE